MAKVRITPEQITSWVSRNFPDYKTRKGGAWLQINNPFDGDDGYHFNINTQMCWVHDWRPGSQYMDGSFVKFVQKLKKLTFREALRDIVGQGVDLRSILIPKKQEEPQEEPQEPGFELPGHALPFRDESDSKVRQVALNYLQGRGVGLETAQKYDLHYSASMVYFPYYEYGMQVYWQGRSTIGKTFEFPSVDPAGTGKGEFLFGFDDCEPGATMFVVESIFNCITLDAGLGGAAATGGATMSLKQAKKIRAINPSKVILAPDNDWEAEKQGLKSIMGNAELIRSVCDAEILFAMPPKPHKDWNDMWREKPRSYVEQNAVPVNPITIKRAYEAS